MTNEQHRLAFRLMVHMQMSQDPATVDVARFAELGAAAIEQGLLPRPAAPGPAPNPNEETR